MSLYVLPFGSLLFCLKPCSFIPFQGPKAGCYILVALRTEYSANKVMVIGWSFMRPNKIYFVLWTQAAPLPLQAASQFVALIPRETDKSTEATVQCPPPFLWIMVQLPVVQVPKLEENQELHQGNRPGLRGRSCVPHTRRVRKSNEGN